MTINSATGTTIVHIALVGPNLMAIGTWTAGKIDSEMPIQIGASSMPGSPACPEASTIA